MGRYLLRRTAILVASLLIAMVVIFLLLRALPGDPANALLSVNADAEQIAAARAQVGSDLPLHEQFVHWFGGMLTLDLGTLVHLDPPRRPGDRRAAHDHRAADPAGLRAGVRAVDRHRLRGGLQGGPLVRGAPGRLLEPVRGDPCVLDRDPAHHDVLRASAGAARGRVPARRLGGPGSMRSPTCCCRCSRSRWSWPARCRATCAARPWT